MPLFRKFFFQNLLTKHGKSCIIETTKTTSQGNKTMKKYNWKENEELCALLADTASAPVAVPEPLFDSQYKFVIQRHNGPIAVKKHVPEWALKIVCKMLDNDKSVKNYFYEQTYKGNIKV